MRRFFNLRRRMTSDKALVFKVEPDSQISLRYSSDADVLVSAVDEDGIVHPLTLQASFDQNFNLLGAVEVVLSPTAKRQTISYDCDMRTTHGSQEKLDLTPLVVDMPDVTPGLTMSQMVLAELRRYGIGREEQDDEDDDDLAFEEDVDEFGRGYMESDSPLPAEQSRVTQESDAEQENTTAADPDTDQDSAP